MACGTCGSTSKKSNSCSCKSKSYTSSIKYDGEKLVCNKDEENKFTIRSCSKLNDVIATLAENICELWNSAISVDYISNVELEGTVLNFTGVGNAFNGPVDLASILTPPLSTSLYNSDDTFTGGAVVNERTVDMANYKIGWINNSQWGIGVAANAVGVSTEPAFGGTVDTPEVQFHVSGHIRTDSWYYTRYGRILHQTGPSGFSNPALTSLYVGYRAGFNVESYVGLSSIEGSRNTGIGYGSMEVISSGYYNTGVGSHNLRALTTGRNNTAIGHASLNVLTTGDNNTSVGSLSLAFFITTASGNTALGYHSGQYEGNFNNNTYIGYNSGENGMYGEGNTGLGYASLRGSFSNPTYPLNNTFNIGIGNRAGYHLQENNSKNIFIGKDICAPGYTNNGSGGAAMSGLENIIFIANEKSITNNNIVHSISIGHGVDNSNQIRIGNVTDHTSAEIPVAWTVTSDERFKNIDSNGNIPGLDFVMQLNPIRYKLKNIETGLNREEKSRYGFSAQQVISIEGEDIVIGDNSDLEHLKLRESMIIPVLVKAIKELKQEINTLKLNNNLQ